MTMEQSASVDDRGASWKKLEKDLDLYKFYLDILLKAAAFILGITGAVTSYYFAHAREKYIVYSLILPFIINIGFLLICSFGAGFAETLKNDHYQVCSDAGVEPPYEMSPLVGFLYLCAVTSGIIAAGLGTLFVLALLR